MKQSEPTKTVTTIIILLIAVVVGIFLLRNNEKNDSFDEVLLQSAKEINMKCPMKIDEHTRLDSVIALPNKTLQYNYSLVDVVKDSIALESFNPQLQQMILNNVKTSEDLNVHRENQATLAYRYLDKNGALVSNVVITADMYQP